MTTATDSHLPTLPQLAKATAVAAVAAAAILVTTVLPAEYGIDPTGIGGALGLTALSAAGAGADEAAPAAPVAPVAQEPASIVTRSALPFRSDEMTLTLPPRKGAEIKAVMRKGEQLMFSWEVEGGAVVVDMHGEPPNAGNEFTSYWKAPNQDSAHGTFVAPFDGTHGWYWGNRGPEPVTVRLRVSGFYADLRRP